MTDSTPPPTSEEVQQVRGWHVRSFLDSDECDACGWAWPCPSVRLADAYMVVVGQRDEAVRALEAFVFHTKDDGSIDYVASDYAIECLRSIQEKGAEGG